MVINGDAKLIAAAFVKARNEMNATVPKGGTGNYGKYATLAAIVEATAAPFANHGLAIVQEVESSESGLVVETWLVHESGATMQFAPLTMPLTDRKPQAVGSAITYGRRYALASICGLAPDDDDDGQAAQDSFAKPRQQQAPRPASAQKPATPPKTEVDFGMGSTDDNTELLKLLDHLNMLGEDVYGAQWEQVREHNVKRVSGGKATSSDKLTPEQLQKLIAGMEKVREKRAQPAIAVVA